jgi:putative flippase GtrA
MSERVATGAIRVGGPRSPALWAAVASPRLRALLGQGVAFLAVGGVGFLVDVGVFTALRTTVLSPAEVANGELWAKAVSVSLAIVVNWVGNRSLAFRRERRRGGGRVVLREAAEFFAASLLGSAVALVCLVVSHDLLGLRSAIDDNVSANIVGLALGTALRFALYRLWVFRPSGTRPSGARPSEMQERALMDEGAAPS